MTTLMTTLNPEDNVIVILKIIAKKSGLFVAKKTDIGVTVAQSVALHNHMKRSTPLPPLPQAGSGGLLPGCQECVVAVKY